MGVSLSRPSVDELGLVYVGLGCCLYGWLLLLVCSSVFWLLILLWLIHSLTSKLQYLITKLMLLVRSPFN